MKKDLLRKLPKVDELLKDETVEKALKDTLRPVVMDNLRETIDSFREKILMEELEDFTIKDILDSFISKLNSKKGPKLRRVINAAGIVIHTNLGRSILCKEAVNNVLNVAENYNNLEYDIEKGQRGSRYSHIEDLIKRITGAEAALVVNNNAAAVMLALDTLSRGKEAIVSRGQLVEIGGSFRIPEVMSFSGAKLVEVGTTNRTHIYDYENSINENTGVLLKVHTSNFKIMGYTEEVSTEELVKLGKAKKIPVVEDIGSGVLVDFSKYGFIYEPTVQESVRKGIDVITFSGDKMLGGPQAGIIVGKKEYIERMKKNQLTRALRIDKMTLAALEGTLRLYLDEKEAVKRIPTLNMILSDKEEHKKRAQRLKRRLLGLGDGAIFSIKEDCSMVGGGSMPTEKIRTYVITVKSTKYSAEYIEKYLRNYRNPIITRIYSGEVLLDLRTIFDRDFDVICEAFKNMGESSK
jgi:L-seryl-tRNA(Ser) seleniumtransferase